MPSSVRTESFRRRGEHNTRTQGASDSGQNRPSSSGGRLEQHLGAVESVEIPSLVPSAPVASRTIGLTAGSRASVATVAPVATNRNTRGLVVEGSVKGGGRANGAPPAEHTRAFKGGGSNGASFGSSGSRVVADEQHFFSARRVSDAGQQQVGGRRVRDRKGGGRRRSAAEYVPNVQTLGADHILAKGGKGGDGKAGGGKTRPRRTTSQISFGSSMADAGGGGAGSDRRGVERGGEAIKQADRADIGTQDRKFRMQAGQSNTLVAVRLRPLLKHDREHVEVAKVLDHRVVILMDPAKVNQEVDPLRVNRTREKRYAFDYVFDATATQRAVYENTTKFLIQGVLDGFNATVFAYGCTGAGKTYTMIGNGQEGHQGIMVLTLQDLFKQQRRASEVQGRRYSVTVSFLEVYNENIRDLLNDTGEFLDLREDPIKGPTVSGLAEVEARTPEEIMDLLHQGNQSRTQQATRANAASSRSHAVLQVVVESRDKAQGTVATMHIGKLSLVDLAGSERAAATQNRGVRLVEGANINRSLLALGNCINALGERGNKGQFVPYRDSKLTRLLKDSLGGNCRTVMIANISGASSSFEETLNTLKYANRAKNIKTNATRNSLDVNHHISEYVNLIGSLRTEITRLKHQLVRGAERSGGGGIGRIVGDDGAASTSRSEGTVFSPSLKTTTNSLFAYPANGENKQDFGAYSGGKRGESKETCLSSSLVAGDLNKDNSSDARIEHQSESVVRGGVGGSGLNAETTRGTDCDSSNSGLGSVPGGLDPPSPPLATTEVALSSSQEDKDFVEEVREKIVENFRERMQLRRSLIELEDQNVQNSIEVGKRQLSLVEWHGGRRLPQEAASNALRGLTRHGGWAEAVAEAAVAAAGGNATGESITPPPPEVKVAWRECEQLCSAISKNNETKRKISRRLRNNSRQAEKFRADLDGKITGEDRNQLMKLQYRIGKLELDNMELEQSRIVHESAMRGKDLTIQKLQLQLAVRDRTIALQHSVLTDHGLDHTGLADAVGVDQVGITDALDAFLPEGVVVGHANSVGSGPIDCNIITHDRNDASDNEDDDQGVLIPRGERRVDGWGSSSESEGGDPPYAAKVTGEREIGNSADNAVRTGSARTPALARTDPVPSPQGTSAYSSTAQVAAAPVAEERLHQQPRDRLEQMVDTAVGGATGQWPNRRPSKTTSRTRHMANYRSSQQTSSSSLQQKPKQHQPTKSRRRRVPSDASCGGIHSQEDRDDDSIEDGLVISSAFPVRFAGGGGETGTVSGGGRDAKVMAGGRGEGVVGQTASVVVAPFHGPLPVPLVFGSGSEALPSVPATGDGRSGDKGSYAPLTDPAAVRGVSMVKQHAQSKDHNHDQNQDNPSSKKDVTVFEFAGNLGVVSATNTWGGVSGRSTVVGEGGADHGARTERGVRNNSDTSSGTASVPPPALSGLEAGGNRVDGVEPSCYQHRGPVGAESRANPGTLLSNGRNVDGGYNMGISGTGVALPWRNSRRHAPAASLSARGAGGGANRRRLRREQTRGGTNSESVVAGFSWGCDGGYADATKTLPSKTSRTIPDGSGERQHGVMGKGGDDGELRGGLDDDRPPAARIGAHGDVELGGREGNGAIAGGQIGQRFANSTKGWSVAGDSLAHLKARMGVKHQQHPAVAVASASAARGDEVADGEGSAREGIGQDSSPHHIPYQAF